MAERTETIPSRADLMMAIHDANTRKPTTLTRSPAEWFKKARFETFLNKKKQPCFRLRAPNGEIILQSEAYSSMAAAENGVKAVKKYAADAEVITK